MRNYEQNQDKSLSIDAWAEISARLRIAIDRVGGSLAVSKACGVPTSTISGYLNGTEARFTRLAAIADVCNVSLDWLATGQDDLDRKSTQTSPEGQWFGDSLYKPVHYWSLITLTRVCREYFESAGQRPTLAEALQWIAGPYKQHSTLPDLPLEISPQKAPSP